MTSDPIPARRCRRTKTVRPDRTAATKRRYRPGPFGASRGRVGPVVFRSGRARSGGSSSGVRSWEELVRETASDSDADTCVMTHHRPERRCGCRFRQGLASSGPCRRPAAVDIILKDPSLGEMPALRISAMRPTVPFHSNCRRTWPARGRAIHPCFPSRPGTEPVGNRSDVWGSSSRVDLLHPGQADEASSGSLERTDEMNDPPMIGPLSDDSSLSRLGGRAIGGGADGSAVDLGSRGRRICHSPLGSDSSISGSELGVEPESPNGRPPRENPDSGTVDLLAAGDEFDLGLIESRDVAELGGRPRGPAAHRADGAGRQGPPHGMGRGRDRRAVARHGALPPDCGSPAFCRPSPTTRVRHINANSPQSRRSGCPGGCRAQPRSRRRSRQDRRRREAAIAAVRTELRRKR